VTRRIISYHKIQQDTDRIARTAVNVVVCGYSARSTRLCFTDRQWTVTDRRLNYRPRSTVTDLLGLQVFDAPLVHCGRCGRYVNDLNGYISVMRANQACCRVISRG
jgi:hypothetical protein